MTGCAAVGSSMSQMGDRLSSAGSSAQDQKAKKLAEMPHCGRSLGTIAIVEPEHNWWQKIHIESPEALIKIYVQQSKCFTIVDRGRGFALAQKERELAGEGGLRKGSNLGKGQIKVADYLITPDIVSSNNQAGGNALGGILGAIVPGVGGIIASHITMSDKTAEVTLSVTDTRSSEEVAMIQGSARKTDLSFGVSGGGIGFAPGGIGLAGAGASSYSNTELGQVLAMAYLDAYAKLIDQLNSLPANAAAANIAANQASAPVMKEKVAMVKQGHLYKSPSAKSSAIRDLPQGSVLFPTNEKSNGWMEVVNESGEKGWVWSKLVGR
jgi:curli biogenesis system outer membrane secretion channel CsgG